MLRCKNRNTAFTLIELLVVIAVIALLMAVLVPTLASAKERARRIACSANVKQFIMGSLLYSQDYDDKLPIANSESMLGDEHTPIISRPIGDIMVDVLGDHKTMKCPWLNEPFDGDQWWHYGGYGYVLGYNYLGGHSETPWAILPTSPATKKWKSPQTNSDSSQLALVTELNFWVPGDRTFAPHGKNRPINEYHASGSGGMTPDEAGAMGGNVGLLDCSVAWKHIDDMQTYKGSQINRCYTKW
jgi:prepilin-type N-terminal cleavage/methylation domain-containing protein